MKIEVTIKKKVFYKNGWGIFGCVPKNKEDNDKVELHETYGNFSIKGSTIELVEGDDYTVELGDIERTDRGDSYPIIKVQMPKVTSSKSQYLFLKSIMTPIQYANFIKKFPQSSKRKVVEEIKSGVIDLNEVKGIKGKSSKKILERISAQEEKIHIINKLSPLGVTETVIDSIIKHYVSVPAAIKRINESMYNLCEVKGLGFKKVDVYALANGEDREGFKRIEACINYLIHEEASNGHSWIGYNEILNMAQSLLLIDKLHVESFLMTLDMVDETIILNLDNERVTSKYYYEEEKGVLENLLRIDSYYKGLKNTFNLNSAIKGAELSLGITYTDEQRKAIIESFNHGVYTITAKAGSGKTMVIKGIAAICEQLNLKYQGIALSGRATQLLDSKGINSATIHRTLGYMNGVFMHDEENTLALDVVILEEASMVNATLWHSVLKAIRNGAKIIIVGDSGQLSGIGFGDCLLDILKTKYFKGIELTKIHRQAQDSGIIEVAAQVREGNNITGYNWEKSNTYGVNKDLTVFTFNDKDVLHDTAFTIITNQMNKLDEETIMDFQILVANKSRGKFSTENINKHCQEIYNGNKHECISNNTYNFYIGDKVIVNGNKYDACMYVDIDDYLLNSPIMTFDEEGEEVPKPHSLFNGTMGIVVGMKSDVEPEEQSLLVQFEGFKGLIELTKKDINKLDLSYAITVHKSQGQSIKNVLFLLDFGAFKLLDRQLVYTAITRTSLKGVVMAENNALFKAINTDGSGLRRTFLGDFINEIK